MKTINIALEANPTFIETLIELIAEGRKKSAKILFKEADNECFEGSFAQSCWENYNSYSRLMQQLDEKVQEAWDVIQSKTQPQKSIK